jgi:hypothetical protein
MPSNSKVDELPEEVKNWLDENLVKNNFSAYVALSEELKSRGYDISKSSLGRYGKAFEDRIQAIKKQAEMYKILREQVGDDEGAMTDGIIRQAQYMIGEVLNKMGPMDLDDMDLPKLIRAIADLSRASVSQKKWMAEIKGRTKDAVAEVVKVAKAEGLSAEGVKTMRETIMGIPKRG